MSAPLLGSPALRQLALLKLRGVVRRALRRVRRPSGALFALVGLVLVGGWVATLLLGAREQPRSPLAPEELRALVQAGLSVLLLVTLLSAFAAKGLYLPREELERLLSAPVSRADLVRYRLQIDLGRSWIGAVVFGVLLTGRMPVGVFAFCGVLLAMLTLSVVRTTAALLVGAASTGLQRLLGGRQVLVARIAVGLLVWLLVMVLVMGDELFGGRLSVGAPLEFLSGVLAHPLVQVLLAPLYPWAAMIAAESGQEFALWGLVSLASYVALFEFAARLRIDYREVSIETSLDVMRRLSSLRKQGGPFGGLELSKDAGLRSVPWLLGRSPFGAVAWIQLAAIRRKARGAVFVALVVLGLVTVFATLTATGDDLESILGGAVIIAVGGAIYLCSGLRFDFRSSLDRMELVKAWPLAPWRVFLATILPEVLLASLLLALAIGVRAAVTATFHPALLGVVAVLPLLTLTWVALDNAVFLFAPVRFVPGQEGALHHMGRTMLLVLLRVAIFSCVALLTGLAGALLAFAAQALFDWSRAASLALAIGTGVVALLALDVALVASGGWFLRRFDVSREVS